MKKYISVLMAVVLLLTLTSCSIFKSREVKVDYGDSKIYTLEERKAAAKAVFKDFNSWQVKCRLISVEYAGDEVEKGCLTYYISFHTPRFNTGGFNSNADYSEWKMILKKINGEWKVVNQGYA